MSHAPFRPHRRRAARLRPAVRLLVAVLAAALALGGCGLFSWFGGDKPAAPAGEAGQPAPDPQQAAQPFPEGMLNTVADRAPAGSPSQYLAQLAREFGWEKEVAENTLLRQAVESGNFAGKVEPFLLAMFFRHGYSVLPSVGEGHQFSRDTIVRGPVSNTRTLVTTRDRVRLVFLTPPQNLQIVYPQDGEQPQIFALGSQGIIAVRKSLLESYLR